jgi:hypothetical protein
MDCGIPQSGRAQVNLFSLTLESSAPGTLSTVKALKIKKA